VSKNLPAQEFLGVIWLIGWLCERAIRSRIALRKEGQVELLWRHPTNLARVQACRKFQHSVNEKCRASSYTAPRSDKRRFQFQKQATFHTHGQRNAFHLKDSATCRNALNFSGESPIASNLSTFAPTSAMSFSKVHLGQSLTADFFRRLVQRRLPVMAQIANARINTGYWNCRYEKVTARDSSIGNRWLHFD